MVKVFLSSTDKDIQDIRPDVVKAIEFASAHPVEMKTWQADYVNSVQTCRKKIEVESTHYLGFFTYLRGWTPPCLDGRSITEAEFDWAGEYGKRRVVFIPDPTSAFALELTERAQKVDGHSEKTEQDQRAFLGKVKGKLDNCCEFVRGNTVTEGVAELCIRVQRTVSLWVNGGLRSEKVPETPTHRPPSEDDLMTLGRKQHFDDFLTTWQTLLDPAAPRLACFLIHGPSQFGQDRLAQRMRCHLADNTRPPCQRTVKLGMKEQLPLLSLLDLEFGFQPFSRDARDFASALADVLKAQHVVLEIHGLQRYPDGLPGFHRDFWVPLTEAIHGTTARRLVVLLTHEGKSLSGCDNLLQDPCRKKRQKFSDPRRLVRLPELKKYTVEEAAAWLAKRSDDPHDLATALIQETGGDPVRLHLRLQEEFLR